MITRRTTLLAAGAGLAAGFAGAARAQDLPMNGPGRDLQKDMPGFTPDWHDFDITGTAPSLALSMQSTPDGQAVTQDAFRGTVTMLYFGYTFCPDVCPLVMQNVVTTLGRVKDASSQVRFLFVTVDPNRDTIPVLRDYTRAFGPRFTGLRGDANALERLTRRYRVAYSVTPSPDPQKYEVAHSDSIFVFDRQLNARVLVPSMATQTPDIDGLAHDLVHLVQEKPSPWSWLRALV
ncbi:MAG TPA: SCO family protein [Rhodopila sp.]|nr:SCO family protein [Rhodopila sp.]